VSRDEISPDDEDVHGPPRERRRLLDDDGKVLWATRLALPTRGDAWADAVSWTGLNGFKPGEPERRPLARVRESSRRTLRHRVSSSPTEARRVYSGPERQDVIRHFQ